MSDSPKVTTLLEDLQVQFERLHAKLDHIGMDVANLKTRMSDLEIAGGHGRVASGELNRRLDRVDAQLDRLAR